VFLCLPNRRQQSRCDIRGQDEIVRKIPGKTFTPEKVTNYTHALRCTERLNFTLLSMSENPRHCNAVDNGSSEERCNGAPASKRLAAHTRLGFM
jgi:hypothetical protein